MNNRSEHIDNQATMQENEKLFFSKIEIPFDKSRQDVWELLAGKLEEKPEATKIRFFRNRFVTTIAASVLILLGTFSVMRFYSKTIVNPRGQHITVNLPDGSVVELNAQSTLNYHPYWWNFSRKIDFSGEGFFRIAKGGKLEVSSAAGKTIVLGTSFNIYARNNIYKVTCVTGKVKVVSSTSEEAILTPNYHAEIDPAGSIMVKKLENPEAPTRWTNHMFNFTSAPLMLVIGEIERQYNVAVKTNTHLDLVYTGYFSKDMPVEQVLNLICKPFGLTFVKKSDDQYLIVQN
nr:FecR family protein [Bacteroidota bacterium]